MIRGFVKLRVINNYQKRTTFPIMTDSGVKVHYREIEEGEARILIKDTDNVFYNNVQELNRDITIAAISEYAKQQLAEKNIKAVECRRNEDKEPSSGNSIRKAYLGEHCKEGIRILEALSATGLRSVRLAKEVPGVKEIIANDISRSAVEAIKLNIEHNSVSHLVKANEDDASILMYRHRKGRENQFDVVDIDPYGTATPFLDAAVQAVKPQGLLCVTCTDMAVLAGNNPDSCYAKYRSMPLKSKCCHEQALRILLGCIEQHANRYSRYVEPLLSISVDFYIRVFVKVHYGAMKAKMSTSQQAYVIRCASCTSYYLQPVSQVLKTKKGGEKHIPGVGPPVGSRCEECGHKHSIGGPIWAAPIYNQEYLGRLMTSLKSSPKRLKTSKRISGIVTMMLEELPDVPLYYVADELSSVLKMSCPAEIKLRSAIINAGYRVSSFHGRVASIKTDAPPKVLWDIMKAFWKTQNINLDKYQEGSAALALLTRSSSTQVIDFSTHDEAEAESKKMGISRFPQMPENWGPKARAKDNSDSERSLKERSIKHQGKRKWRDDVKKVKRIKVDAP